MTVLEIVLALLMVVGVVGIVVPILPGLLLVLISVLIWALESPSTSGWTVLGISLALFLAGTALQWLIPGRAMKAAGVRTSTLLVGVAAAITMAFVIPVVGLFVGFPVGIFLVSLARTRDGTEAWRLTRHALRAVGTNILIELATAFTIIAVWAVTVLFLDAA